MVPLVLALAALGAAHQQLRAPEAVAVDAGAHLRNAAAAGAAAGDAAVVGLLRAAAGAAGPAPVYVYSLEEYDPGAAAVLAKCPRRGADFHFLKQMLWSPRRVVKLPDPGTEAVYIVPCLLETRAKCDTEVHLGKLNDGERPPDSRETAASPASLAEQQPSPEEYEAFTAFASRGGGKSGAEACLSKVRESPAFKAGRKHIWVYGYWDGFIWGSNWLFDQEKVRDGQFLGRLQVGRDPLADGMAVGTLEVLDWQDPQWCGQEAPRHCAFVIPYSTDVATAHNADHDASEVSFEAWDARSTVVSYRYGLRKYALDSPIDAATGEPKCTTVDAAPLRAQSLNLAEALEKRFPDNPAVANVRAGREPAEQYASLLDASKFCLVIRGDTRSTHSFYDSLARGCVPVVVSDGFFTVAAPFRGAVDYARFTVSVPEAEWTGNIDAVAERLFFLDRNITAKRALFTGLQELRKDLLWAAPGSRVGEHALAAAEKDCFAAEPKA